MENKNYIVSRDNIYGGKIISTDSIYRFEGESPFHEQGHLYVSIWRDYRSTLFVLNENNLSNDLLYNSPNYPILNVTDDETCLSLTGRNIVIDDAISLAPILEYFGYKKDLTYEDVIAIRKKFFKGRFAKDNCKLFGYKETIAEDVTFYTNGEEVTNPKELERLRKQFRAEQKAGHRMFSKIGDGPLPREYFHALDDLGDNTLIDAIQWHKKMNAFAPPKQEGPIKKLTRF